MLFIFTIHPLQRFFTYHLGTQNGTPTLLPLASMKLCTSLYANDAAIFISPNREDLIVKGTLNVFGEITQQASH